MPQALFFWQATLQLLCTIFNNPKGVLCAASAEKHRPWSYTTDNRESFATGLNGDSLKAYAFKTDYVLQLQTINTQNLWTFKFISLLILMLQQIKLLSLVFVTWLFQGSWPDTCAKLNRGIAESCLQWKNRSDYTFKVHSHPRDVTGPPGTPILCTSTFSRISHLSEPGTSCASKPCGKTVQ